MDFTAGQLEEFFAYLDDLRMSGVTNMMFGASPYLADEFELGRGDSARVLLLWIETFDGKSSTENRAAQALAA